MTAPHLLIVISTPAREPWARETATACNIPSPVIFTGSPVQAAAEIERRQLGPTHIILDIGNRTLDVLPEIDQLAQQCKVGTRVLSVGDNNDILLYRGLLSRGVIDYLALPCDPKDVAKLLMSTSGLPAGITQSTPASGNNKRIIAFIASGSGDGASTAALNTAYALSQISNGHTVLIDMDYQYGMVGKHLHLQNQYGIHELFDNPERGIDATLIKHTAVRYGKLDVITAPSELRFLPAVGAQAIADLLTNFKLNYDNIVIDLPHLWLPWIATILQNSTHIVLVSQLWLKSVSHAARMTRTLRELDIPLDRVISVINRSGAKFKEAINPKDFERVCGVPIRYTLANDIRTITAAETNAKTVLEIDDSALARDIMHLAQGLMGNAPATNKPLGKPSFLSKFKQ